MDTNIESSRNNNFIYALGFFCLLSILSTEFETKESDNIGKVKLTSIAADCIQPTYLFI